MVPSNFVTMEEFRDMKLRPGEPQSMYLHDLRQLIDQAMPKLDSVLKEQLILYQFIAGLQSTLERAKLLLSLEAEQNVAAVTPQWEQAAAIIWNSWSNKYQH